MSVYTQKTIKFNKALLASTTAWASENGLDFSDAVRRLVRDGLTYNSEGRYDGSVASIISSIERAKTDLSIQIDNSRADIEDALLRMENSGDDDVLALAEIISDTDSLEGD